MSAAEKAFGIVKSAMLYNETIKAIREDIAALGADVAALGKSHGDLAEKVAGIEGYLRGRSDQAALQWRRPEGDSE
jgi:phage-related protein